MQIIYLHKYKTYNDLSEIEFPEITSDIKEITLYGTCINLFGFIELNNNIGNNLKRLGWLIKAIKNNILFTIAGENKDKQYIEELANNIYKYYNLKLNYKYINYKEYISEINKDKFYYSNNCKNGPKNKRDLDFKEISKNSDIAIRCYINRKKL